MTDSFGRHGIPRLPVHPDRRALVVEICRNARVLHVGCADAPYTAERLGTGELLHERIGEVAEDLWGLDLDEDALEMLRRAGYEHVFRADLCHEADLGPVRGQEFDIIVATEVIEHVLCPGALLTNLASLMTPAHTRLLVTVPNAYRVDTLLGLLRNQEFVHPDHNAWYSWYTAENLLKKAGLTVVQTGFYSHRRPGVLPTSLFRLAATLRTRVKGLLSTSTPPGSSRDSSLKRANAVGAVHGSREGDNRLLGYLTGLPARLFVTLLSDKPALWADGIYLVAEVAR